MHSGNRSPPLTPFLNREWARGTCVGYNSGSSLHTHGILFQQTPTFGSWLRRWVLDNDTGAGYLLGFLFTVCEVWDDADKSTLRSPHSSTPTSETFKGTCSPNTSPGGKRGSQLRNTAQWQEIWQEALASLDIQIDCSWQSCFTLAPLSSLPEFQRHLWTTTHNPTCAKCIKLQQWTEHIIQRYRIFYKSLERSCYTNLFQTMGAGGKQVGCGVFNVS